MYKYLLVLFIFTLLSCANEEAFIPKPHAFPKITFPKKEFVPFNEPGAPYSFEFPAYAKMIKNKDFMGEELPNEYWYDMYIADFDAKFHITYYQIKDRAHFDKLINDTYRLSNEHVQKANAINETPISKEGVYFGKMFDITGPAATPLTFFMTDEDKNFFRASLYLNTQVRPDSLSPIYDFLKVDAKHIINTFVWK